MIIGRRDDFIIKIRRDCAAWRRQDAQLGVAAGKHSLFITALDSVLELTGVDSWENVNSWQDFPDAVFVEMHNLVSRRDPELKRKILEYFEKHDPRSKTAAKQQLTLQF